MKEMNMIKHTLTLLTALLPLVVLTAALPAADLASSFVNPPDLA